jgi:hypothetical protein
VLPIAFQLTDSQSADSIVYLFTVTRYHLNHCSPTPRNHIGSCLLLSLCLCSFPRACMYVCVFVCGWVCLCVSKTCNLQPRPLPPPIFPPTAVSRKPTHSNTHQVVARHFPMPSLREGCMPRVLQPLSSTIEFCSHHVSPFFLQVISQCLSSLFSHLTRAMSLGMVARGMGRLWRLCVCLSAENHCSLLFILPVRVGVWGGPIGLKTSTHRCQLAGVQGIGQNCNPSSLLQ